jgi:hypothetical protein
MIAQAIKSLFPQSEFVVRESDGNFEIEWIGASFDVTKDQIIAEAARLQAEFDAKIYQRKRAVEYPPMFDYLDGIVKGDQAQVQAYIDACLAVKAKYPK